MWKRTNGEQIKALIRNKEMSKSRLKSRRKHTNRKEQEIDEGTSQECTEVNESWGKQIQI